jgi:hypothetical protein
VNIETQGIAPEEQRKTVMQIPTSKDSEIHIAIPVEVFNLWGLS